MTRRTILLLSLCLCFPAGKAWPGPASGKWGPVIAEFEGAVREEAQWLEDAKGNSQKLRGEIAGLEMRTSALRKELQEGSNVIGEIRLKTLLNGLRSKLEENSDLQKQVEDKQKDFEQKALSLTALYNDRIEAEVDGGEVQARPGDLDERLDRLTSWIKKRDQTQRLLAQYRKKGEGENLLSLSALDPSRSRDRETLRMTMDLFRDRKKELEEQIEKWSLEEDQTKNELKLQGKMQEFLEDIRQINEDSDLPRGGLKHGDLEGLTGRGQKGRIEARLSELRSKISKGQRTLEGIDGMMARVQHQTESLDERSHP